MGEVYRARDTRLDRDVAIKVLAAAIALDPDRVARFDREAKAIAALSHPNILAVFDTGVHDGHPFVVTELLEGETLTGRLHAGPLPLRKAIDWGGQIARGLAAAHGKGVIHRDLKPDNLFITADGHAKILDFGLAKAVAPAAQTDGPAGATMTAAPITDAGTVMGTAGYMSPEQVRGEPIDTRSDLFAFGAVLYEMLSGERAFRRDTTAETMTAILRDDPPDVSAARSHLSPGLDRIVHHCLEKQASERFQSARDVAFALDALSGSGATPAAGVPMTGTRTRVTRERLAWSALALALAAAVAMLSLRPGGQGAAAATSIATLLLPDGVRLSTDVTPGRRIAISPDGRHLAFVGVTAARRTQLWLRSLDRATATAVEGSDGASGPFWSPDSRFVAFLVGSQLRKVPTTGGPGTLVGSSPGSGTWNAEDVMLVSNESSVSMSMATALRIVAKNGGQPSDALVADAGTLLAYPFFLPDGQHFLFALADGSSRTAGLFLGRLGSTEKTRLDSAPIDLDNINAMYASGHIVAVRGQNVVTRPFDPKRGVLGAELASIAGPVEAATPGGAAFSVSQTGVLVFQPSAKRGSRLVLVDRSGKEVSPLGEEAEYSNVELSPDGSQLLTSVPDPAGRMRDIWVVDIARGVRTRVTFDPSEERSAVWTADGKSVVYTSKGLDLYMRPLGAGAETPLVVDHISKDPRGFSPDGRFLVYRMSGGQSRNDIWVRPMDGGKKPFPFLSTQFDETAAMLSPDGRWLAYGSDESGKQEVYVTSFPSGAGKWQISTAGGTFPRWRHDGKEMFYLAPDNTMMSVRVTGADGTFTIAAATRLFPSLAVPGPGTPYDVSANGERFVINTVISATAPPSLTIVFNWPHLLTKQESR